MARDPRNDPKPGDVLYFGSSTFTVLSLADGVIYDISGWRQTSLPIELWREYSEKWEVLHASS